MELYSYMDNSYVEDIVKNLTHNFRFSHLSWRPLRREIRPAAQVRYGPHIDALFGEPGDRGDRDFRGGPGLQSRQGGADALAAS